MIVSFCFIIFVTSASAETSTQATETFEGAPVGFTEQGYPYRGDLNAPVRLEEYSDYLCPFCGRHFNLTLPKLLDKYAASGQVTFVFRDFPLASLHPTAAKGHAAALCVAEQGAALFWVMHDELFRTQGQWNQLPDPSGHLAELADRTGADMAAYEACIESGRNDKKVEKSVAEGKTLGFNGTPSFRFINTKSDVAYTMVGARATADFEKWVEALLKGEEPPAEQQTKTEPRELPFWAKPEGLMPDSERPGFTKAGDQYRGNPNAPLTVVEFSDFQCPACKRHVLKTQPTLDEQFVASGDVFWVFKHLPLKEHARAPAAAAAAECAAEQNQFWPMHQLLFANQERWSETVSDKELLTLAKQLELDQERFTACIASRQALERVLGDIYDAVGAAVRSTPTFVLLYGGRGGALRGALPAEQFASTLQKTLEEAKKLAVAKSE